jgi:hypothetical protein
MRQTTTGSVSATRSVESIKLERKRSAYGLPSSSPSFQTRPSLVIVLDEPNDTGNPLDEDEDEIAYRPDLEEGQRPTVGYEEEE